MVTAIVILSIAVFVQFLILIYMSGVFTFQIDRLKKRLDDHGIY